MSTLLLLSNPVLSEHYVLLIFVWKRDLGVTLKGEFYTEIREFLINISFFYKSEILHSSNLYCRIIYLITLF